MRENHIETTIERPGGPIAPQDQHQPFRASMAPYRRCPAVNYTNEDRARLRRYLARVERGAEMWLRWSEDNEYVPELPIDPEEMSDVMDGFRLHRETLRDPRVRKVWEQVVAAAHQISRRAA